MLYFQCILKEVNGTGVVNSWLPAHAAEVGKTVEVLDEAGDHYRVEQVFTPGFDAAKLKQTQDINRRSFSSIAY